MGERTPHLDAQARGGWFGLTAAHTRAHLIRAIFEGVAFSLRDSLEIFKDLSIPVEEVRASGGGSRSFLWREIQADIYAKPLVTLGTSEGSAFGAALLAGVGAKVYSSVEESARQVAQLEKAGLDSAWVAEAYGYDGVSFMGYLAARTERVKIASGILPIYTRTPTLLAMTAAVIALGWKGRLIGARKQ